MVDKNMLLQVIADSRILGERCIIRDGFVFSSIGEPHNVYDAIVILNPNTTPCFCPRYPNSTHCLEEHIQLVNDLKLEKAIVYGLHIDFLPRCPTLKYLSILPADEAGDGFDFSPLYQMPEVIQLHCRTEYGKNFELRSSVDYQNIKGLRDLSVSGKGHLHYQEVSTLQSLGISGFQGKNADLTDLIGKMQLKRLRMIQCSNKSLNGIQQTQGIERISISYNRVLSDISQLSSVADTLRFLSIENCPNIHDFGCLSQLTTLEFLQLRGKNILPDMSFLKHLPNLKELDFDMDVADGDITPCLAVPAVYVHKFRKHYNLTAEDFRAYYQRTSQPPIL